MADTKNYGLKGVGNDVQFGKAGGRFVYNTGGSDFRATTDGTTLAHLQVLDPVGDTDAATKLYVDNIASGLDPKESVQVATTANLSNFTTGGNNGQFTGVPASIDGVTLAQGDRVLVKDQSTTTQNGIYVVTATTTTIQRADDHDGTPAGNVSGGNFVFVEGGGQQNTGWVLQGDGALTVNTDAIVWVQFSGSGTFTAGDGISLTGSAFDLDFVNGGGLTSATAIAGADQIAFADATNSDAMQLRTMTNVLADLDIVTATGDGILVRTAADTYGQVTITASATATEEGLIVTNGNGVSGNPTIGLDIQGTTSASKNATNTDELILFDGTNNLAYSVAELAAAPAFGSGSDITVGDTSVVITDTGTDGTITTTADNSVVIVTTDTETTFSHIVDFEVDSATTNADIPVITLSARSTGTPAAGIGPSIQFEAETAAGAPGNLEIGGVLALEATDVTSTSEDFDFVFNLMAAGATAAEVARIDSTGDVTATSFNGVALTTAGSSGNFLNETGTYTALTSNATHTGQVTGATALSLDITAITAQPASGALVGTDTIIVNDGGVLSEATMTQVATFTNATAGTVTSSGTPLSNEVAVFTSGTDIDSDSTFTWDATTLTVNELSFAGDTISNNTTDQPIIIRPNGTGSIIFQNGSSEEILELNDTASAVNGLALTAGATGNDPTFSANATGSETNVGIGFVTKGTGALTVDDGAGTYETRVTADDDIPNKKYVDDAVAAGVGLTGNLDSVTGTVDLTTDGAQNIGAAGGIPAGATVLSVTLDVTTISDNGSTTTVTVGRSGATASYMAATENDAGVAGIYIADGRVVEGSAQQATATVASSATTTGAATCIITFRHA